MHALNVLASALLATSTFAHMALDYPPAFNATNNPHRTTRPDPFLQYPYDCCGEDDRWEYPCRGYHKLLGTPDGAPTATWEAGSTQSWNISGIGNHFGGSCQVGFSTDGGKAFRVVASYEGNCPHRNSGNGPSGQDFELTVPSDIPAGVQIFAWIWYNREQEFNMNCAAVNVTARTLSSDGYPSPIVGVSTSILPASSTPTVSAYCETCYCESPGSCYCEKSSCEGSPKASTRDVAFNDRPLMFVADDGNDCVTPHTIAELKYPNPGPNVVQGDGVYPLELPSGGCSPKEMLMNQAYSGANENDGQN